MNPYILLPCSETPSPRSYRGIPFSSTQILSNIHELKNGWIENRSTAEIQTLTPSACLRKRGPQEYRRLVPSAQRLPHVQSTPTWIPARNQETHPMTRL